MSHLEKNVSAVNSDELFDESFEWMLMISFKAQKYKGAVIMSQKNFVSPHTHTWWRSSAIGTSSDGNL
jgi:hypothetical protein